MTSTELENLARIGQLKREPSSGVEIAGMLQSADQLLTDSKRTELLYSSRFHLAYGAAHALALAALRLYGYRSENRYLVFQVLPQTVGMPNEKWRILAKAHELRNLAEYEGHLQQDDRLLTEVIVIAGELRSALRKKLNLSSPRDRK